MDLYFQFPSAVQKSRNMDILLYSVHSCFLIKRLLSKEEIKTYFNYNLLSPFC